MIFIYFLPLLLGDLGFQAPDSPLRGGGRRVAKEINRAM